MKIKKLTILFLALTIVWTAFIWFNSALPASVSDKQSNNAIHSAKIILDAADVPETIVPPPNNVRKLAHVFEYTVQAFLLCMALSRFNVKIKSFNVKVKGFAIYVLFVGLFTAVLDEFIQLFSIGRGSRVSDVLLDFGGVLIGIGLFYLSFLTLGIVLKTIENKRLV